MILNVVFGLRQVGCDMVEVSPPFDDSTSITSLSGATVRPGLGRIVAQHHRASTPLHIR
jgi:hypothetical protein